MDDGRQVRIDVEAAKALAEWKAFFGAQVSEQAKLLAAQAGQPDYVTLSHYRTAAKLALQTLSHVIHGEPRSDGRQEAA